MRTLFFLLLTTLPAAANMTAAEFEEYVTGRTLTYADNGVVYGMEEYLPNRRVRWSFVGDECREGYWYEEAGEICFVYEHNPSQPQCWTFEREGGRLRALFSGAGEERALYEATKSREPLRCLGPEVGV